MREFVRTMHNPSDLDDLLERLLCHADSALGCAGAAIMLEDDCRRLAFAAASSEMVTRAERVQSESQPGVCHAVFTTVEVLAVSDLTSTDRWGAYTERGVELGLRAVIGVPLTAWGQTISVLTLYRDRPTPWSDGDAGAAELLAERLHAALASHARIERAGGSIMQREGVASDTAFDRLRTTSMHGKREVRDIARQIIEHHESRWPTLAMESGLHQRPASTATASGPDRLPVGAAVAVLRAHALAETSSLADVATRGIEQRFPLGPQHDEERHPAEDCIRDTAAAEGVGTSRRGIE